VSTDAGKITLTWKHLGKRTFTVGKGPNLLSIKPRVGGRALAKGRYKVSAQLRSNSGKRSKSLVLGLRVT